MKKRIGSAIKPKISGFIYWTPRILSIIFVLFLALLSFDVFGEGLGFWQVIGAFLMHNIPSFILAIIVWISWKHEIVGGIGFVLGGILYIVMILRNIITTGFEWYYLSWAVQISGIAFFIGILFFVNWYKKRR